MRPPGYFGSRECFVPETQKPNLVLASLLLGISNSVDWIGGVPDWRLAPTVEEGVFRPKAANLEPLDPVDPVDQ